MSKIFFRRVEEPYPKPAEFWHIEYFPESTALFPVALAVVCSFQGVAQLNFIFVADQWRQKGIAGQLISACLERWPSLQPTAPMSGIAEHLLRKFPQFDDPNEV